MSNSVSEFLSKKGIKTFKNGAKAIKDNMATKAIIGTMALMTAFSPVNSQAESIQTPQKNDVTTEYAITQQGDTIASYQAIYKDDASFKRMKAIINKTTQSETGRDIIKSISEQGTVIFIDSIDKGTIGYFDPSNNAIALNKSFDDGTLESCLVHEGKHSIQSAALNKEADYKYSLGSNIKIVRVMEADAMASQAKYTYEMAEQGDSLAWKSYSNGHAGILNTYKTNAEKYGKNDDRTMQETMLAWYDDKGYVAGYDVSIVQFGYKVANAFSKDLSNCLNGSISNEKLVDAVCTNQGEVYVDDANILDTPRTKSMNPSIYKPAAELESIISTATNTDRNSLDDYYVEGQSKATTYGKLKAESEKQNKKEETKMASNQNVSPLVMQSILKKNQHS